VCGDRHPEAVRREVGVSFLAAVLRSPKWSADNASYSCGGGACPGEGGRGIVPAVAEPLTRGARPHDAPTEALCRRLMKAPPTVGLPCSVGRTHRCIARVCSGAERTEHTRAARATWTSIDREAHVDELDEEFTAHSSALEERIHRLAAEACGSSPQYRRRLVRHGPVLGDTTGAGNRGATSLTPSHESCPR
jgi:hypothetical protein